MSSSDSWTLIGLTILVVLLLFYLSKKMICGSNGNNGDSGGGGSGRNSIVSGRNHTHHQNNHPYHQEYFEEEFSPDAYNHHQQSFYSEYNPTTDPDNPHHQDQNSEHRLNLDYNSNQEIGEDVGTNRPYYYYPHHYHHYHNLPHYPSQSVSLRELLEICSRSNTAVRPANNQQQQHQNTFPSTATALPGNYRTNTSSSDNQHCHDPSLDTNNAAASDSGLVEVSVISDTTSSSTPPTHTDNEPISNSPSTIELTERKKQLIEKQLRNQIVRMIQAEREVRRLAHLLSLQQGLAVESPGVPATTNANVAPASTGDTATVDREHEPYCISEERLPPHSSPNNSFLHSHHPNYSGHNEVILSAHALNSRYPHHLIRGGRNDHHHHHHHNHHPSQHTLTHDECSNNSSSSRNDEESADHEELPPPPYEDCVPSSSSPS